MFDFRFEPTISEIMREPMVRALMKADRVDAGQFEQRLRLMAREGADPATENEEADEAVSGGRRFLPRVARIATERCCWA